MIKQKIIDIFPELSSLIWNQGLWTQSGQALLENSISPITLCLDKLELVIFGRKDTIMRGLNWWNVWWISHGRKLKDVKVWKHSVSSTHWEGGRGQGWAVCFWKKFMRCIRTEYSKRIQFSHLQKFQTACSNHITQLFHSINWWSMLANASCSKIRLYLI